MITILSEHDGYVRTRYLTTEWSRFISPVVEDPGVQDGFCVPTPEVSWKGAIQHHLRGAKDKVVADLGSLRAKRPQANKT